MPILPKNDLGCVFEPYICIYESTYLKLQNVTGMKKFENTALWALLHSDDLQADSTLLDERLIDEFVAALIVYCHAEEDLVERIRTLRFAHGKISARLKQVAFRQVIGVRITLETAIAFIECELDIIKMKFEHRELFAAQPRTVLLAKWGGSTAQLLELIVALWLSGCRLRPDGSQMSLSDAARLFKDVFGMKIRDLYGRKSRLLIRKKNESPFLDNLLFLYRQEVEKMSL